MQQVFILLIFVITQFHVVITFLVICNNTHLFYNISELNFIRTLAYTFVCHLTWKSSWIHWWTSKTSHDFLHKNIANSMTKYVNVQLAPTASLCSFCFVSNNTATNKAKGWYFRSNIYYCAIYCQHLLRRSFELLI